MKRLILSAFLASAVYGCATTSGLQPSVQKSGFDGATIVDIEPHGASCESACLTIGAQWNSKVPEGAILDVGVVGYTNYYAILGAEIRIGRKVVSMNPIERVSSHSNEAGARRSSKSFAVPFSVIEEIIDSDDVWIRVKTSSGNMEDLIISGGKDSKAYHALRRFVESVRQQ